LRAWGRLRRAERRRARTVPLPSKTAETSASRRR